MLLIKIQFLHFSLLWKNNNGSALSYVDKKHDVVQFCYRLSMTKNTQLTLIYQPYYNQTIIHFFVNALTEIL
jgi:hypothetical protein